MAQATLNGTIVMPPVPAFYNNSQSIDGIDIQLVGRAPDLLDIHLPVVHRWKQELSDRNAASGAAEAP